MNDLMTRSFLNYVDLKKQAVKDFQSEDLAQTLNTEDEQSLCFFLQEAEQIKIKMTEITAQLQALRALNEESKSIKSSKDLQELRNQIDSHTAATSRMVMAVKSRIETLSKSNPEKFQTSVADRTRTTILNGLKCRFKDITRDFAILRDRITDHHQQQETLHKPDPATRKTEMLQVDKSKTTDLNSECEKRNEAVMDIMRSLDRLHQVFLDMAVLVEEQEDQIDDIEKNMASSGRSISGGTNSLYYANQRKKKDRRRWYWIGALGLMILLVCLVAALSS